MIECKVIETPIDTAGLIARAGDPAVGAVAAFVGTVRNSSPVRSEGEVVRLEYEAYVPMAEREMMEIAGEVSRQFDATHLLVHHRIGRLEIGDAAVAIVVSTRHRSEAFDACRMMIEELKKRVPIWKKEIFHDGAEWVNARP
jgi:molybdopterin synthase catalytic subunit